MTAQEAYEYLRSMNISLARGNGKTRFFDAIKKAIEAIEKQIPKEPHVSKYTMFYSNDIPVVQMYYNCPNCCCSISKFYLSEISYCPKCGQAIKQEDL